MDIQGQLKCQKHRNNDILFVKVKNIKDEEDVFYCELCPFSESNFSMSDCTPIKSILNWNEESPIINLFPFNDQELIKKLKDIYEKNIYEQLPNQINQFYDDLQAKIMQMIFESKKTSITLAQQLCEQKQKLLQQYKQAINADEIKKILQSQNSNTDQIQKIYKDYMKTVFQNSERNTQILNDLNKQQQITYGELKLVQQKIISSSLLQIKNDNDFIKNFPLILPNQVDLMPQLKFRKVDKEENMISKNDILKIVNGKIQFKMFNQKPNQSLKNYFYESNLVLNQSKLYIFRFQISNMQVHKIEILLSNKTKAYDIEPNRIFNNYAQNNGVLLGNQQINYDLFGVQLNNGGLFGGQQNNQRNFLINIQNNGNNQIQFININSHNNSNQLFGVPQNNSNQQSQFYSIKGDLNQSFNIETLFEIKILVNKGIFEVSDYPNKQIIVGLAQQYRSQLQTSLNQEFVLSFKGSIDLIHATEFEQEIQI
ncbi:hypothetical protein TTHERM_00224580 (macronuclear) [Tetrahymena thermophila SB210]|uniref:Zinc carboxypeptidase family protein n=1 Tax=Tetrahymena thermophila (strain SB210) TaxID=312017 RepID=Q23C25_TETTS|nr:hypothetical protein TTHERM_00224580 [Tetrahymena thermophila SB210]EAR93943.2 hypothetical protein TTHERM_00224580 [Tetrahymena thermophila SB210]|eukprot:XP_001014188.2 hypothetical protein TTHERM_00224580 [Tetrahymena thermophila SB210]